MVTHRQGQDHKVGTKTKGARSDDAPKAPPKPVGVDPAKGKRNKKRKKD